MISNDLFHFDGKIDNLCFQFKFFFIDYVGKIVQDYFLHNFIFWLDLIWILHNFSLDFQTYLRIKYERKCDMFTQP